MLKVFQIFVIRPWPSIETKIQLNSNKRDRGGDDSATSYDPFRSSSPRHSAFSVLAVSTMIPRIISGQWINSV